MAHLPFAFWIIGALRPSLIAELGTYRGVSFCAFCQAINDLGLECNAYGTGQWKDDLQTGASGEKVRSELASHIATHYANFAYLIQSSFEEALPLFAEGTVDLLHLNGCRGKEEVENAFKNWLPKMSRRGIVLIHDICARLPGYGVVEAWSAISAKYPTFSFHHGYGLGIVAIGEEAPQNIREICELEATCAEADEIRAIFRCQGMIYEYIFARHAEREAEIARNTAWKEQLVGELEKQKAEERKELARYAEKEKELFRRLEELTAENQLYKESEAAGSTPLIDGISRIFRKK